MTPLDSRSSLSKFMIISSFLHREMYPCQKHALGSRASSSHQAWSACIGMDGWLEYFLIPKKPCFSEISRKLPYIFFCLFLSPLDFFVIHLLWNSQQKKKRRNWIMQKKIEKLFFRNFFDFLKSEVSVIWSIFLWSVVIVIRNGFY